MSTGKTVQVYQTKIAYRCNWLKIFHHNIDFGIFNDESDAIYSLKEGMFSILGLINDNYKINGQFEFLLEYPDQKNNSGMNRWAQNNNPLDEIESSDKIAAGYEQITLSWTSTTHKLPFCGLSKSSMTQYTLIDGTNVPLKWYFSIGAYQRHGEYYLPGYTDTNKEVILWMRIKDGYTSKCNNKNLSLCLTCCLYLFE